MGVVINSAFDAIGKLPVAEVLEAPELVEQAVNELIEGEQAYHTLFRTVDSDFPVIEYHYELAPELDDDVAVVPEFGEIPVSDPKDTRQPNYLRIENHALAIRVSEQQVKYNLHDDVQREVRALARGIIKSNGAMALSALKKSPIEEFPVEAAWDTAAGDPYTALNLAIELIMGAVDDNGNQFDYQPNIFWANPVTINRAKRSKTMQDLFIGDMASSNPVFKKIEKNALWGDFIQVVPDLSIPLDEGYLGVEGTVGVDVQNGPADVSPFYEEGGQSGKGGPRMTHRSDYNHFHGMAVKAPKSVVKLTGLATAK